MTRKAKKVNPNRIPIDKKSFNKQAYIEQACESGLHHAWLLILSVLVEQEGMSNICILDLWNEVNACTSTLEQNGRWIDFGVERAAEIMGLSLPESIFSDSIEVKTVADRRTFIQRATLNAILSSLALICLRIETAKCLNRKQLQRVFLNVSITREEISHNVRSYIEISQQLAVNGLELVYANDCPQALVLRVRQLSGE